MVYDGRTSRDPGTDVSGHQDRRRKKERDNTRVLEGEETCKYEEVVNGEMTSHDSGFFTPGVGSHGARKKESVKEKKKPTIRRKLVTENVSEEKSTHGYQNGDLSDGVGDAPEHRLVNGMGKNTSQDTDLGKGLSGLGARKNRKEKEKVEKKEQKRKPSTHLYDQNRGLSVRPGTSGVWGTLGDGAVNGLSSIALSGHIKNIIKNECLTVMKDVLTTALEKVEALESKATKRTIEYEEISPAETPKRKRELSPASSAAAIPATTAQRVSSAVGQYPAVPGYPGTNGNDRVDGNTCVQTEQSVHVLHQYYSTIPVEDCVFFEPVHIPEGSRSVTSVTSSQWRQQWMTIDNDHNSVVSGVSSHWRQHRTTDDENDSDNSGSKSPQSEKKSFFERQDLSNADGDGDQPEDAVVEDLSSNLLEFSINGRTPRKTHKGSKSSDNMYEMSSIKINLMSASSYVGSPSDRRSHVPDHVASSPRSQPPPNANQRPVIRQPRLSLPASPQTVSDAGTRNCRCPRCGSVCTTELELEEHYFEHLLGNRSCAVGGCEYTCSSRNELRRHIRAAHLRKHTCRRCGKAYLMASTLERHLRQCLPCRQCPLCPGACIDDASLCDHVARAHGARQIACNRRPELTYYVCRECRFATTSRTVALDHCQRHILGEINLNITLCEICDLIFVAGDLHFLMHAIDDSLNRKSFQVVDFDWRVSLNARRQLESSLKKTKETKAIKASIDEEISNVDETTIETNDISPQVETQLKSQEVSDDSIQENNSDENENKFDVTDKVIETNLSLLGERVHKMQDLMQKYLDQRGTVSENQSPNDTKPEDILDVSTMKEPVQSEQLVEIPLEQQNTVAITLSNENVDNNQSLPSTSTAEDQNKNANLNEESPTAKTNFEDSNVETNDIVPKSSKMHLKRQVAISDNKARIDSGEENTSLQVNNQQTFLDHTKELNEPNSSKLGENLGKVIDFTDNNLAQCGTDSNNQLSKTIKQDNGLAANTMKEPVQSEQLVKRRLEQQNTVAMSQSNGNVDKNQNLPSTSTAEVQNQNTALCKETDSALVTLEELNVETTGIMASANKVNPESQVILNDKQARVDLVEKHTSLQEYKKQTYLDNSNELNKRGTVSNNQPPNTTKHDDVMEASTITEPDQSKKLVETVERHFGQQTMADAMIQTNGNMDHNQSLPSSSTGEVQNQYAALDKEAITSISNYEDLNKETNDIIFVSSESQVKSHVIDINDEASGNSEEQTWLNLTKSRVNQSIKLMQEINNILQEVRKTKKDPVHIKVSIESPVVQQPTLKSSELKDTTNGQSSDIPFSTSELLNENAALDQEIPTAGLNFEDSNVEPTDIIPSPNEVKTNDKEACNDSLEENTSLQENKKQTFLDNTNELNKSGIVSNNQAPNTTKHDDVLEASTINQPAEVLNQNAAFDKTPTARSNFEDSNVVTTDIILSPNKVNLENDVILNGKEGRDNSVEENISLQENNKPTSLDYTNELSKPNSSQLRENEILAHDGTDSKNHTSPARANNETDVKANLDATPDQQTTSSASANKDTDVKANLDATLDHLTIISAIANKDTDVKANLDVTPDHQSTSSDSANNETDVKANLDATPDHQTIISASANNDTDLKANLNATPDHQNTSSASANNETDVKANLDATPDHQTIISASANNDTDLKANLNATPDHQNTSSASANNETDVKANLDATPDHQSTSSASANNETDVKANLDATPDHQTIISAIANKDTDVKANLDATPDHQNTSSPSANNETDIKANLDATPDHQSTSSPSANNETDVKANLDATPDHQTIISAIANNETDVKANLDATPDHQSTSSASANNETDVKANLDATPDHQTIISAIANKDTDVKANLDATPDHQSTSSASANNETDVKANLDATPDHQTIISASANKDTDLKANLDATPDHQSTSSASANNDTDLKANLDATPDHQSTSSASANNETDVKANLDATPDHQTIISAIANKDTDVKANLDATPDHQNTSSASANNETDVKANLDATPDHQSTSSASANNETDVKANLDATPDHQTIISAIANKDTDVKANLDATPDHQTIISASANNDTDLKANLDATPDHQSTSSASANNETDVKANLDATPDHQTIISAIANKDTDVKANLDATPDHQNTSSASANNETDVKANLDATPDHQSTSSASASNETDVEANLDATPDHQTRPLLTVISGSGPKETSNGQTSGEENKTVASTTEKTNTKNVVIEKGKDLTSNAKPKDSAKTTKESDTNEAVCGMTRDQTNAKETENLVVTAEEKNTKQVLTEKSHVKSTTERRTTSSANANNGTDIKANLDATPDHQTISSASANNDTDIKANLDVTSHHQTRADLTVISGSEPEETSANGQTSGEENKTAENTTLENNTKDGALRKTKELNTRTEETTSPGSPTEECNLKENSEEIQKQTINEETKSSSCTEKTEITNLLEKTTKETDVKKHSQTTQDLNTTEKRKQYEKSVTHDKDELTGTTSKKGQQANRARGRSNNNKKRNNKKR